jgi:hypothetical protein
MRAICIQTLVARAWQVKVSSVAYMSSTATSPWARSRYFGIELSSSTSKGRGNDANLAKEQLQTLEEAQGLRVADRERLSKELVSLQAAGG